MKLPKTLISALFIGLTLCLVPAIASEADESGDIELRAKAESGDAVAQFNLGVMYF
ncbi:MAG: hypothetical protein JRI97_11840, partial [Deltaproteobacteria bacterium]|nr:hypothetical protein [Deltaproteobacteria bacterium]